jgi:hypothetical protein
VSILLLCLALAAADDTPIHGEKPTYELSLPSGYRPTSPRETPPRFIRPRGREPWELVSVVISDNISVLRQNPDGVKPDDVLSCVPFPPGATWTFAPLHWKEFDIASYRYQGVIKDVPIVGFAVVFPLRDGTLTLLVYAPETLESQCREEFDGLFPRVIKAPTHWHSPEHHQKVRTMNLVTMGAAGLIVLYLVGWGVLFREDPMRLHWLRTFWLVACAVLLFLPISSPGEMTFTNNVVVNLMIPMVLLLFVARRIKMAIELT